MKKIIHHLRRQPEETKRHILHIITLLCAFILVLLWVYSLGNTLEGVDIERQAKQDFKPFSAIKDNVVNGFNNIIK